MPLDPSDPTDADTLARLRRYIAEPTQANYADDVLSNMYDDALGDLNVVAAEVWREKAGKAASLVDISEGASSRKMSQVTENAMKMAAQFTSLTTGDGGTGTTTTRSARTRAIERI